jgi:hypothetical protein
MPVHQSAITPEDRLQHDRDEVVGLVEPIRRLCDVSGVRSCLRSSVWINESYGTYEEDPGGANGSSQHLTVAIEPTTIRAV